MAKKQSKRKKQIKSGLIVPLAAMLATVVVIIFEQTIPPEVFRHIAVQLTVRIVISVGTIVAIWLLRRRNHMSLSIVTSVLMVILAFAGLILPDNVCILLYLLVLIGIIGMIAYAYVAEIKVGDIWIVWCIEALALFLYLAIRFTRYHFADIPFLKFSLIIGVTVGIIVTVKWLRKGSSVWKRIGWTLSMSFIAFMIVCMCAMHLNYALDMGQPGRCDFVIEGKEIDLHRRHSDYELILVSPTTQERITLNVSANEYYAYEIGHTYPVVRYDGAFDEPFYISGKYLK